MDFRNLRLLPRRDGLINEESDAWNMNEDNDQTDPATELRLDFGFSNQHEEQLLHDALGAGANAGSMVDMAFVTPVPLSELVWSPHKGLSLKCADFSFRDRNPSVLRGAEPSNQTSTHKLSVPGEKSQQLQNRISKPSSKSDCDDKHISSRSIEGNIGASIFRPRHIIERGCADETKIKVESAVKEEVELEIIGLEQQAECTRADSREGLGKLTTRIDRALASDILVQRGCQASASLPSSRSLEKRESTAENELMNVNVEALESISHQPVEKLKYADECVEADRSPSFTRTQKKRKRDKEKPLSDGYAAGRNSNGNNDNYECLESCAGTSSKGEKRGHEQQHLAIGSKRFKNQINGADGSTSCKRQDSSFRNWIANMINSSPNSIMENQSPPALAHAQSDNELDGSNKQLVVWKKSREEQNVGPSRKGLCGLSHEAYYKKDERYKDSVYDSCDANAAPLAFHIENNISYCEALVRKEKVDKSSSGNENLNESVSGNMLCYDHGGCDENQMTVSGKRKVACDPLITFGNDINGTSSSSSMGKRWRNNTEDIISSGNGEDHLKSLWISRLSVKTSSRVVNLDSEDQTSDKPNSAGKREIQRCAVDCGCSTCLDRNGGHEDKSSFDKFNPMLLSARFRSSEAMAAIMARRFDALKHNLSNVRESSTAERITCLFCGSRDHKLQNCSKIAASEVEQLSEISSFFGVPTIDSSLCIVCFQLDHWAVSCPFAASRTQYYAESGHSFINHFRSMEKQPETSGLNSKFLMGDSSKRMPTTCTTNHTNDHNGGSKSYNNETSKHMKYNSFVHKPPSDGRVVFDTMKKLQLSRTDILRWMNSNMSLSKLEGLFLRLRLGKWEKGFRGTGYHVAFITGSQNARNSISVKVGGVEFMAKSHCISNQVFLEEELRGWWEATSRDRSRVIVEADLEARIEKKRLLGL